MTLLKDKNQDADLTWQTYFERENKSFFKKLCRLHREVFIARAVRIFTDRYFSRDGIFLEAGSGTSQSSSLIRGEGRRLVALDLNHYVLCQHNVLAHKIQGNILALPLADNSLDGIWNLGVMEHFTDDQIVLILSEMRRTLKPEAKALLFWPPPYAPFQMALNSITWFAKTFLNKRVDFFPDEVNRYTTRSRVKKFLGRAGLKLIAVHFTIVDLFSYAVVVAEK